MGLRHQHNQITQKLDELEEQNAIKCRPSLPNPATPPLDALGLARLGVVTKAPALPVLAPRLLALALGRTLL